MCNIQPNIHPSSSGSRAKDCQRLFVLKCNVFLGFIILSHAFLKQNAACQGIQMWQQQVPIKRQYVMSRTSELESHQHIWRACLWTWRALLTATRDIIKTSSSACCLHRCRSVIPWLCQSFPWPYLPLLHSYSTNIQMWGFFLFFMTHFLIFDNLTWVKCMLNTGY